MKLHEQITNVEQSKRLAELGIEPLGVFSWVWDKLNQRFELSTFKIEAIELINKVNDQKRECYNAFTVAELCKMLPNYYWAVPVYYSAIDKSSDVFQEVRFKIDLLTSSVQILSIDTDCLWYDSTDKNLATAMAGCLIYLIENGLISIVDINNSLK